MDYVLFRKNLRWLWLGLFRSVYHMFDVTLQSDVRKVPVETSVSAQLYVMTPDSLCCSGKDNRPQNLHRVRIGK